MNSNMAPESSPPLEDQSRPTSYLSKQFSVPHIFTAFTALAYITGYLVHSSLARGMGIQQSSVLKAEYLEIGLVFLLLSIAIIMVPLGILIVVRGLRREKSVYEPASIVTLAMTLAITVNFTYVILFFALFVSNRDWRMTLPVLGVSYRFIDLFNAFLMIVIVALLVISLFRLSYSVFRKVISSEPIKKVTDRLAIGITIIIRVFLLAVVVFYDYILVRHVPQVTMILAEMKYYLAMLVILSAVLIFVPFRMRTLQDQQNRKSLLALGVFFSILLLYLTILAYSYTVYRIIPVNRGGWYPTVRATMGLEHSATNRWARIIDRGKTGADTTIPLFVVAETKGMLYCAIPFEPLEKVGGEIYGIRRSEVRFIEFEEHKRRRGM